MPNIRRLRASAVGPLPRRRLRRRLLALLAIAIACLFAVGSVAPAVAAPASPALRPTEVPIAQPTFTPGCIYVPHNAYGDKFVFFCPTTEPQVQGNVILRDADGNYPSTNVGALFDFHGQRPGENYSMMKSIHAAWNGFDCDQLNIPGHVGGCENVARYEAKNKPVPTTRDTYTLTYFLSAKSADTDSPCKIIEGMNEQLSSSVKCIDPRKEPPCPTDVLAGDLLTVCESVNAEVYETKNYTMATEGSERCETQTAFCDYSGTTTPIASSLDSDDDKFLKSPIKWTSERLREAVSVVSIWWILAPEPLISDGGATGMHTEQNVNFLVRHTNAITLGLVALSIIVACVRMVLTRQMDHARQVAYSILVLVLVSGLSVLVINALVTLSSWYCIWILVRGLNPTSDEPLTREGAERAAADAFTSFTGDLANLNFILMVLLSLCLIAGGLVQWAYMTARIPLVTLLAGTLPLAAAATNTEAGKTWMSRHLTYLAAFIFIKPAAVTVFVASARLFGDTTQQPGADSQFRGALILLLMSLLLPALIKMIFPIVTPATGGQAAATTMVGGVLAGGARLVRRS